jgi:hypothetical protein
MGHITPVAAPHRKPPAPVPPLRKALRYVGIYFGEIFRGHWSQTRQWLRRFYGCATGWLPSLMSRIRAMAVLVLVLIGVGSFVASAVAATVSAFFSWTEPYFLSPAVMERHEKTDAATANGAGGARPFNYDQIQIYYVMTYFEDGAIAADWTDQLTDTAGRNGQVFRYHNDPADSTRTTLGQVQIAPPHLSPWNRGVINDVIISRMVCTKVVPGSTRDLQAGWRRTWLARRITELRDGNFVFAFLGLSLAAAGVAVLVVIVAVAATIAVLAIVSYLSLGIVTPVAITMVVVKAIASMVRIVWAAIFAPVSKPWHPQHVGEGEPVLLRQVSDLHLRLGGPPYEVEEDPSLWQHNGLPLNTVARAEDVLRAIAGKGAVPLLAYTGDVVDLGEEDEWQTFLDLHVRFFSEAGAAPGVLLIPGNHDVCINQGVLPDISLQARDVRVGHCLKAIRGTERGDWSPDVRDPEATLERIFPRTFDIVNDQMMVRVYALDSTHYQSRYVLSNAVGELGDVQLARLKASLEAYTGPVVVIIHHHVSWAREPNVARRGLSETASSWVMSLFLITLESRPLLRLLRNYARRNPVNRVLLIHGHKHRELFQRYGDGRDTVFIYGHPSSTMGNVEAGRGLDGLIRFAEVRYTPTAGWDVRSVTVP